MIEQATIYIGIALAAVITYGLRCGGLVLAKRMRPDNPVFIYISYITYALMSALVVKLIITPTNQLADVPLSWRLAITLLCLVIYLWHRKHLIIYLLVAVVVLSLFPLWS